MAGLFAQAVEHAVRPEGDEDQLDALRREGGGARCAVRGAGQQGQLLVRDFQDVHQAQRGLHLGDGGAGIGPEVGAVVGVVGDGFAHRFGAAHRVQRGGAGGVGGQADRAEVHQLRLPQGRVGDVGSRQHHVGVGAAVKAEVPLAARVHRHHRHGGGIGFVHRDARGVHAVFAQHLGQVAAEGVVAHLADEGGLRPQLCRRDGQVGGRAAGVRRKLGDAFFILAGLGQVDQNFTDGQNVHVRCSFRVPADSR